MTAEATTAAGAADSPYNSKAYRYYALGLLTLTYAFNFVDRQILAILQEPIKAEAGSFRLPAGAADGLRLRGILRGLRDTYRPLG